MASKLEGSQEESQDSPILGTFPSSTILGFWEQQDPFLLIRNTFQPLLGCFFVPPSPAVPAGTTCLIALLSDKELTVANVGDSRGVLCDKDGNAIPLSHDHKPYQLKERKRIKRAGGFISFNGSWRVQGILAMSRSLGDYPLKNLNVVIPDPDILSFDLDKLQPEFMILASDGLWDAFSNEEAVRFIKERLDEPHFGAKSIVLQSFYRGCPDNITVMVVKFRNSSKAEEQQ
ncbi:hypothetical protein DUI87_21081 [Hirundo rustica rustica]|uniref:PPM-type phosphatase domain-containing protein n=1 Tax=Hirundo rustica rustica TaxID=333673 RepID=A0A3M0JT33_HIRRU|nr:hypothetical protein DUI87_21081 [Hirundo rustica rustica]